MLLVKPIQSECNINDVKILYNFIIDSIKKGYTYKLINGMGIKLFDDNILPRAKNTQYSQNLYKLSLADDNTNMIILYTKYTAGYFCDELWIMYTLKEDFHCKLCHIPIHSTTHNCKYLLINKKYHDIKLIFSL